MTTTAQNIIDKVESLLQDENNDRWSATDHLKNYNEGQKAIVVRKPDAYVKNENITLVAGTRQTIDGFAIVDIVRNMGLQGGTPGQAITKIDRTVMDLASPNWHSGSASATVKHWMYDSRDPKRWWCYPPQPSSNQGKVDGIWCTAPPAATPSTTMVLDEVYEPVLMDYMLFRAYSKDAANSVYARDRAVAHAQIFLSALGSQESAEQMVEAASRE